MGQSTPPSPAPSADGVLQSRSTMNSTTNTSHPRDARTPDRSFLDYSQSRYSTPVHDDDFAAYDQSSDYSQLSRDGSFGNYSSDREARSIPFGALDYGSRIPYTPEASPPTPCPTNDTLSTRSGLNVSRREVLSKSLKVKGGGVKKKARESKSQTSTTVEKPLSEVAKGMPNIVVADIATFVVRTTEERLKETSRNKKAGQVKRPMNAFMLYRKAYQNVAKTQCAQNNHQHVSKVCGVAWRMEPKSIHDQFDEWARIERSNHQKAHPEYKFTPSKPQKTKRDGKLRSQSTPFSDGEDSDWANSHGITRNSGHRQVSRQSEPPSLNYDPYDLLDQPSLQTHHTLHPYPTPGRLYPQPYGHGEYVPYDVGMQQHSNVLGIMHEGISRTPSPSLGYRMRQDVSLDPNYMISYDGIDGLNSDPITDPSLLPGPTYGLYDGYDEYHMLPQDNMMMTSNPWSEHIDAQNLVLAESSFDKGHDIEYLKGNPEDWVVEELDQTSHYDSWATAAE